MKLDEIKQKKNLSEVEKSFSLEIGKLTGDDSLTVLESKRALMYGSFLPYIEGLGENWRKHASLFFKKVYFSQGGKTFSLEESVKYTNISFEDLEKAFKEVLDVRSEFLKDNISFNYLSLDELKKRNILIDANLSMKNYLCMNFSQEVMAFAFLTTMDDAQVGYLFSMLPKLESKKKDLEKDFIEASKNVKTEGSIEKLKEDLNESIFKLYFSEKVQENLKEAGLF